MLRIPLCGKSDALQGPALNWTLQMDQAFAAAKAALAAATGLEHPQDDFPIYTINQFPDLKTEASFVFFFRKSFAGIPREFHGRVLLF